MTPSTGTFGPSGRAALRFGDQKISLRPVGALELDPAWTHDLDGNLIEIAVHPVREERE